MSDDPVIHIPIDNELWEDLKSLCGLDPLEELATIIVDETAMFISSNPGAYIYLEYDRGDESLSSYIPEVMSRVMILTNCDVADDTGRYTLRKTDEDTSRGDRPLPG